MLRILPDRKRATGWLVVFYLLVALPMLIGVIISPPGMFSPAFKLHDLWGMGIFSGLLIFPFYIYIFYRTYEQLKACDFIALSLPFIGWLIVNIVINAADVRSPVKSTGNWVIEPPLVFLVTGAYFLVFPISRRYPDIARPVICGGLLAAMLLAVSAIICFTPGMGE